MRICTLPSTRCLSPLPSYYLSQDFKPPPQCLWQVWQRRQTAHQQARLQLAHLRQLRCSFLRLQATATHRDSAQGAAELQAAREQQRRRLARRAREQVTVVVEEQGLQVRVVRQQRTNQRGVAGV